MIALLLNENRNKTQRGFKETAPNESQVLGIHQQMHLHNNST